MKQLGLLLIFLLITQYICASVVINEVLYNPYGTPSGQQWIELFNASGQTVNLEGWQISVAGQYFHPVLALPRLLIQPGGFVLIGGDYVEGADLYADLDLPFSDDHTAGIRLTSVSGYTDTILYGEPNTNNLPDDLNDPAHSFAPVTPQGHSLARIVDGLDTNDNANDWFVSGLPTPGQSNIYLTDLALNDLQIDQLTDRVSISVRIHNPGVLAVPHNEASLRIFLNGEHHSTYLLPELLPEYQSTEIFFLTDLTAGYYSLNISLSYQYDPNPSNNDLSATFIAGYSPLVINELMFKQSAGNQEWVEIYNRSELPVEMTNFYLEDAAATRTYFSGLIPLKTYMVICRYKEQFLKTFPYVDSEKVIESTSWAILNNDFETLALIDQEGNILDYAEYATPASYPHDVSLERINPYDDYSAWDRSIHPKFSTPAAPNSLLPLQYDLLIAESSSQIEGNQLLHTLEIANIGYQDIPDFSLICYLYENDDQTDTIIFEEHLYHTGSNQFSFTTPIPTASYVTYRYKVESELDLDPSNNYGFSYFNNNSPPVVINEIMFQPVVGEPRWIELKVNSFIKYLFNVILQTERYTVNVPLTDHEYILLVNSPADSLFILQHYQLSAAYIITGLTSIYVSGEELTLYDPSGNVLENFRYDPVWSKTRGVSAERINPTLPATPDNWAHSIDHRGATPGEVNSIYTPFFPSQASLSLSPNPFSPFRGERTIISFELPERLSRVNCRIFDLKGRLVNTIIDQEIYAAYGTMIWDGRKDDGNNLPVGVYIVLLEATGSDTEKVYRKQGTVVIAR